MAASGDSSNLFIRGHKWGVIPFFTCHLQQFNKQGVMWAFLNDTNITLASYVVSVPHQYRVSTSHCTEFSFTPPFTTSSQCWTRSLGICPATSFDHIQSLEHITSASHPPKVAVALRISPLIGTYCHSEYLLCNRLNVGLPILHKSRQGSALWKVTKENTRSIETTSRSSTNPTAPWLLWQPEWHANWNSMCCYHGNVRYRMAQGYR